MSNTTPTKSDLQQRIETQRERTVSVARNDTEWKKLVEQLRKDGPVTMMGIQQVLSQGALGSIKTFEDKETEENDCGDRDVYRRLSTSSLERVVKKMLRSDPDSLRCLTSKAPSVRSNKTIQRKRYVQTPEVDSNPSMHCNIYKLKAPIDESCSRRKLLQTLETAFHLSALQDEVEEEDLQTRLGK